MVLYLEEHGSEEDGSQVLFSHGEPVAGYNRNLGWWKTSEDHSKTTTKHINEYFPTHPSCWPLGHPYRKYDLPIKTLSPNEINCGYKLVIMPFSSGKE
tara:strand:- start:1517 stop:1810 length:294 start_codon:yes stop_codon:yes gene_type:complete